MKQEHKNYLMKISEDQLYDLENIVRTGFVDFDEPYRDLISTYQVTHKKSDLEFNKDLRLYKEHFVDLTRRGLGIRIKSTEEVLQTPRTLEELCQGEQYMDELKGLTYCSLAFGGGSVKCKYIRTEDHTNQRMCVYRLHHPGE